MSCVALTKVVARALAPKLTNEVETKPVPFTVRVKAAPPALALVGEMVVIVGAGLFTVKLTGLEVPPPGAGLVTVTLKLPALSDVRGQNRRRQLRGADEGGRAGVTRILFPFMRAASGISTEIQKPP